MEIMTTNDAILIFISAVEYSRVTFKAQLKVGW